jgi:7-carboxy-7-deazaguanine synthase
MSERAGIPIAEIFGPTIQGEGLYTGRPCCFVRVAGCDYRCKYCDTEYAQLSENVPLMTSDEIVDELVEELMHGVHWVVITGGNPLLYEDLGELVDDLHCAGGYSVAAETQGSIFQSWVAELDWLTISPKGAEDPDILADLINAASGCVELKIVVFEPSDIRRARELNELYPTIPMTLQVGNRIIGPAREEVVRRQLLHDYERLINEVTLGPVWPSGACVRVQQHVLLWGNKRGI